MTISTTVNSHAAMESMLVALVGSSSELQEGVVKLGEAADEYKVTAEALNGRLVDEIKKMQDLLIESEAQKDVLLFAKNAEIKALNDRIKILSDECALLHQNNDLLEEKLKTLTVASREFQKEKVKESLKPVITNQFLLHW